MAIYIRASDSDHNKYFHSMRLRASLDADDISNDDIDTIAYLQSAEDALSKLKPDLLNDDGSIKQDHNKLESARRWLVFQTAIELLYDYPQIIRQSNAGNADIFSEIDIEKKVGKLKDKMDPIEDDLEIKSSLNIFKATVLASKSRI